MNSALEVVKKNLQESSLALAALVANHETHGRLVQAADVLVQSMKQGGKAISCGNGGSMCDAMHFAEELTGRFRENREPLAAVSISDPSHMSCVGNDFGYDQIFARYVTGLGRREDVLFAISTSGKSPNVILAAQAAKAKGMKVIALTGKEKCELADLADVHIGTPGGTRYADRVQELHIKCIHILIELCELGMK